MINPFRKKPPVSKPNRNSFSLSFSNNLSLGFGKLYPVMCKEVIPGDSFKIDPTFAFRFMPMVFPVQNTIRAHLKFYYVRNRTLWDKWQDFISGTLDTDEHPFPYISQPSDSDFWKVGSLSDYLGVPVTVASSDREYLSSEVDPDIYNMYLFMSDGYSEDSKFDINFYRSFTEMNDNSWSPSNPAGSSLSNVIWMSGMAKIPFSDIVGKLLLKPYDQSRTNTRTIKLMVYVRFTSVPATGVYGNYRLVALDIEQPVYESVRLEDGSIAYEFDAHKSIDTVYGTMSFHDFVKRAYEDYGPNLYLSFGYTTNSDSANQGNVEFVFFDEGSHSSVKYAQNNPFASDYVDDNQIRLSALPYRAYLQVWNAWFRDYMVEPMLIDGKPEYNKFLPNTGDGADTYNYELMKDNWEKDFLTFAMPSPQQGVAPLVGARVKGSSGVNNGQNSYFAQISFSNQAGTQSQVGYNGNIVVQGSNINERAKGRDNVISGINVVPQGMEEAADVLQRAIDFGISINDLRSVNALQRWLEKSVRHGFRYKDKMEAIYGVELSVRMLDMPEYIGGVSQTIDVSTVMSQADTGGDNVLGSYAGSATAFGTSDNSIYKYFDEHGFVIAVLSVVPVPTYSQLLHKHFLKNRHLDYFAPQFGHIGYQPITYKEVTPVQLVNSNPDKKSVNDVFAYQRAWYDYLSSYDEVHGLMRTSMRHNLIQRTFLVPPELSGDFLHVDDRDINDVFAVQANDGSDKILGQIYFKIVAERPIPAYGEPRLE